MKRIECLREQAITLQENEEDDYDLNIDRINRLQREVLLLISDRNSLELELDNLQEDLNKAFYVKVSLEKEISYLDKILFTSKIYNVINDNSCPFCLENTINKGKCICGSDKNLEYEKFIYSDKEYLEIMKSKIKGLSTTNDTINFCENEIKNIKKKIENINNKINYILETLSNISKEISQGTNFTAIDDLTQRIVELREEIMGLELLRSKNNELTHLKKEIEKKDILLDELKLRLDKLDEDKNNAISDNLREFISIYDKWMREFYNTREINVSLDRNYKPIIGYYQEQSFNVPKRFFYYLALLQLSLKKEINYPKFTIIDTLKDKGIDLDRLKLLIKYLNKLEGYDYQLIMTSGYEEYPADLKCNIIDRLNDNNKLLKKK